MHPYHPGVIRRRVFLGVGLVGLGLYAWLAVQVYRARVDPETFGAGRDGYGWILGPPADALNEAADRHIDNGVEILSDTALSPAERINRFHEHLRRAEALLVRSLRAQPAQARTLSRLATVRWELEPPFTTEGRRRHLELIELASRMAPNDPAVQMELGRVLLLMGNRDEALDYLRRTATLAPDLSGEIVSLMSEHLFEAGEMLAVLPRSPDVLVALRGPFESEGREREYLDVVRSVLDEDRGSVKLIRSYGTVSIRSGRAEEMIRFLDEWGPLDDPEVEAVRLSQRSRGFTALGDTAMALRVARQAAALQPDVPQYAEALGDAALEAQAADEAIEAFRGSLALVARRSGSPEWRARLYRRIGQAQEHAGRSHEAYDSYNKALALDPDEPIASRRVEEIERTAGIRR